MYIILGATGHVGSAVVDVLLEAGQPVTAVTRDDEKAAAWRAKGARAAVADVQDTDRLNAVFRTGRRAFLLNPPADPATDTDAEEHRTFAAIVRALDRSGLEHVVVESTYGAQPGEALGDLSVLYDFERALLAQPIPVTRLRAAYYMSNWDTLLAPARDGEVPTLYPADLVIPMVAPADIGEAAAALLREPPTPGRLVHVEGPSRYTPADVAAAFAKALGRSVALAVTPREQWEDAYRKLGFSAAATRSYARMTAISVDGAYAMPADPRRGRTTLDAYVEALVARHRVDP